MGRLLTEIPGKRVQNYNKSYRKRDDFNSQNNIAFQGTDITGKRSLVSQLHHLPFVSCDTHLGSQFLGCGLINYSSFDFSLNIVMGETGRWQSLLDMNNWMEKLSSSVRPHCQNQGGRPLESHNMCICIYTGI